MQEDHCESAPTLVLTSDEVKFVNYVVGRTMLRYGDAVQLLKSVSTSLGLGEDGLGDLKRVLFEIATTRKPPTVTQLSRLSATESQTNFLQAAYRHLSRLPSKCQVGTARPQVAARGIHLKPASLHAHSCTPGSDEFYSRSWPRQVKISAIGEAIGPSLWMTRSDSRATPIDPMPDPTRSEPFNINPALFLLHARKNKPPKAGVRVSDFSSWVYGLHSKSDAEDGLILGALAEAAVLRRRTQQKLILGVAGPTDKNWELVHCGMAVFSEYNKYEKAIEIPSLTVNGCSLWGSPDLVFVNEQEQKAIVVEIKYSRAPIPSNLWPNVWAQLWAYAQIPWLKKMSHVELVGEVWGDSGARGYLRIDEAEVFLRASVHRNPRSPAFDRFFRSLFCIYASGPG